MKILCFHFFRELVKPPEVLQVILNSKYKDSIGMRSSINAIIVLTAVLNHQHAAASAAMTAHPDSTNQLRAMSMAWNVIEATSRQSNKTGKTIRSRSSKLGGKASKVLKRSKADGLEDDSKPQQEEKVTFYVE
jgi:hypothetical protein